MRILFSSIAAYGHVYPMLPLAIAARDAGHDVAFATPEEFHPVLAAVGLHAVRAGLSFREARAAARSSAGTNGSVDELKGHLFGYVFPMAFARDLTEWLEGHRADLVVYGAANVGALLAAKRADVPRVCHGFGRMRTQSETLHDPLALGARAGLSACATELGVAIPEDWRPGNGDAYLDVCPPSLQAADFLPAQNRFLLRPEPVDDPHELPAWVLERDRRRPLVYLTLGTASGQVDLLREAIAGLTRLDVDVLVAAGPSIPLHALGDPPGNVRLEAWVPQAKLLPHADLVIHHGGGGTGVGAFYFGLPQLVLPPSPSYVAHAEAVRKVGAGDYLPRQLVSPEAVAMKTRLLLDEPAWRDAARALAVEIARMPSPREVVAVLEDVARSGGTHG